MNGVDERERQENVDAVERVVSALVTTEAVQKIERGIQRFADNMPWLMKTLDEVAKIHPVVTSTRAALWKNYLLLLTGGYCSRGAGFQGCLLSRIDSSRE